MNNDYDRPFVARLMPSRFLSRSNLFKKYLPTNKKQMATWSLHPSRPKLKPGALLDIIEYLLWDIYSVWLLLEDVCRLDSAICVKGLRPDFLRIISSDLLLFLREELSIRAMVEVTELERSHRVLGLAALNWIRKRGIHLASLRLPPTNKIDIREQECICAHVASLFNSNSIVKLEMIDFRDCTYLEYSNIPYLVIAECYSTVKSIDVTGIQLPFNVARCVGLEALATNGWFVATMVKIFEKCPKLRIFVRHETIFGLSNEIVQSIATHSHLIEHLDLGRCSTMTDGNIMTILGSCPLLQVFRIDESNITDAAVLAIATMLPGLKSIGLSNTFTITSRAVETLASKCHELESIDLSLCPNVGDRALVKIADHCPRLKELSVDRCHQITGVGLGYMAALCLCLERVLIPSSVYVQSLCNLFPTVRWFQVLEN